MILFHLQDEQEVPFLLVDDTGDRLVGLTLEDIEVLVWKPGFADFGSTVNSTITREMGNGWYVYVAGQADADTLGSSIFQAKHASSEYSEVHADVVPHPDGDVPIVPHRPLSSEGV